MPAILSPSDRPLRSVSTAPGAPHKVYSALRASCLCALTAGLVACGTEPPKSIVQGPMMVTPVAPPANLEHASAGSLYPKGMAVGALFAGRQKPRNMGDLLKIDIAESYTAANSSNSETSRDTNLKSTGPGAASSPVGLLDGLFAQNITSSGGNAFKGSGTDKNSSSFTGQLAASVIRVLTNGNLVVAGERAISINGGIRTMRFSGVVDPNDLNENNVIASRDVVNARLEVVAEGDANDASKRTWLQRVLTNNLAVW